MRLIVAGILLIVSLSGCTDSGDEPAAITSDGTDTPAEDAMLTGFIFDPAITPLAGATVRVLSENLTALADNQGAYSFGILPESVPLILVAEMDGFVPASKSLTIQPDTLVELNFTLTPVSTIEPRFAKQTFTGFLGCDGVVVVEEQRSDVTCAGFTPQHDPIWDFSVDKDIQGLVIEVIWEPETQLAQELRLIVETQNFGQLNEVLADTEGISPLRADISRASLERFYREGGVLRVTVEAGYNAANNEAPSGASVAFQEEFEVFTGEFYHGPAIPGYSITNV